MPRDRVKPGERVIIPARPGKRGALWLERLTAANKAISALDAPTRTAQVKHWGPETQQRALAGIRRLKGLIDAWEDALAPLEEQHGEKADRSKQTGAGAERANP